MVSNKPWNCPIKSIDNGMNDSFDNKCSPEVISNETWEIDCEILIRKKRFLP